MAPLMTTRLTHVLFIWLLLLLFSFSLYSLLFTFSWLVLKKVCMQFKMFPLDKCECESSMHFIPCELTRGYVNVTWVALYCQGFQENIWGGGRGREGGSIVTVMLILHCRNSILPLNTAISDSAFSLGYGIDIDETHRPWSFKQCTGDSFPERELGGLLLLFSKGRDYQCRWEVR